MRWLAPDSAFMQGLSTLTDAIWINVLMAVSSLPVITAGAALAAGHDALRRSVSGEGRVTANYCRAFRANLPKATLLWLAFGLSGAALAASWIFLQITPLLIVKFGLSILWVIGFEWVFALQARFENSVGKTLANAFVFGVMHIGWTALMVAFDGAFLALLVMCWMSLPQGLLPLALLGYGSVLLLHTPILERVFSQYVAPQATR